jgi:hypothetical protein
MFFHGNVNKEEKLKGVFFCSTHASKTLSTGPSIMAYFKYNLMRVTVKHTSKCSLNA